MIHISITTLAIVSAKIWFTNDNTPG
jgi:hypothetical protein